MESLNESTADTILARQKLRSIWVAWKMHIYEQKVQSSAETQKATANTQLQTVHTGTQEVRRHMEGKKRPTNGRIVRASLSNKQKKAHLLHQYYSKLTFFKKLRTHIKTNSNSCKSLHPPPY